MKVGIAGGLCRLAKRNTNNYASIPSPMAAQHSTVTMDKVTLRLVIEWAGLGLRSQHLVNKYSNKPNKDTINSAAGTEPSIPKLCKKKIHVIRVYRIDSIGGSLTSRYTSSVGRKVLLVR